jgi:hypothetical protein
VNRDHEVMDDVVSCRRKCVEAGVCKKVRGHAAISRKRSSEGLGALTRLGAVLRASTKGGGVLVGVI